MQDTPGREAARRLGRWHLIRNVSFSYPSGQQVLAGIRLAGAGGPKVGIVGRSGAGKSTILALLQRLYDPVTGRVLIDEQDIAKSRRRACASPIAVVQQDISLFHRSVLENLRYGKPEASDEEVHRAAEAAHCTDFINRLPQGFDTMVGERGLNLSGGQRQRLAIARAFLLRCADHPVR